jgi:hypothetical protein
MKNAAGLSAFLFFRCLYALSLSAQDINSTIEIRDFSPTADPLAKMVTEIVRTKVASSGLIRVIESSELVPLSASADIDATMEGSVLRKENVIAISYRLIENSSGRTISSEAEEFPSTRIFMAATSIGADVGNKMLTNYFASGIGDIQKLISLKRYEEADQRLLVYRRRFGDSPQMLALFTRISRGLAEQWFAEARELLRPESSTHDQGTVAEAHDCAVAAVSLLPANDQFPYLGPQLERFIGIDLASEKKKEESGARSEIAAEARRSIAAGDPEGAMQGIDDFLAVQGMQADTLELENLKKAATLSRARGLAALALEAARSGDENAAESFAYRALSLAPSDDSVISLVGREKASLAERDRAFRNGAIAPGYPQSIYGRGDWDIVAIPGLWVFGEGTLDAPFTGAIPGIGVVARRDLEVTDALSLRLSLSCEYASSRGAVTTQAFPGRLDQYFVKAALGGGLAFHAAQWVIGADLSVGAGFFSFSGTYAAGTGAASVSAQRMALCVDILFDGEYFFTRELGLGGSIGFEPSLLFGYGLISCVPINAVLLLNL